MKQLRDVTTRSLIVCYKEDISALQNHLSASGLAPTELRGQYSPEELRLPAMTRCLINHRNAWRIAANTPGYTLICEADFVPCQDIGTLPVFWPDNNERAWGYLYQGSPRLLSLVGSERYLRAHCAPTVAYIINSWVAERLLQFFEVTSAANDMTKYFNFEVHIQWWLMGKGAEAYMPARHYGEHGGLPNVEHARLSSLSRQGRHRADNLARPLAFLPEYARGSRLAFWKERIEARAYGWGRLASGRWISRTNVYTHNLSQTVAMQYIGLKRLMPALGRSHG